VGNERGRPWRVLSSTVLIDSRYLRLRSDAIELPNGARINEYYVRETRGFAVIFPVTPQERVVLVRQYKHGINERVLELPAGAIDPGENAVDCAVRELAEETGYAAPRDLELIRAFITDPTNSDGRFSLFLARDVELRFPQKLDPTEEIDVELASFEDLRRYVRDGTIAVNSHVASIYTTLDYLGKLS